VIEGLNKNLGTDHVRHNKHAFYISEWGGGRGWPLQDPLPTPLSLQY